MDPVGGEQRVSIVRHIEGGPVRVAAVPTGGAAEHEIALRVQAEEPVVCWHPGDAVFLVRRHEDRDEVALAEYDRPQGVATCFRILTSWVPVNRRSFRRYRIELPARLRGGSDDSAATVRDVSMSGMRARTPAYVAGETLDVCLSALGHSMAVPCDVLAATPVPEGWELRLRYRDVSAQSLVLLSAILAQLHALETHRPATLAA